MRQSDLEASVVKSTEYSSDVAGVAPVFLLKVISFRGVVVIFGNSNQALLARDTTVVGVMGFLAAVVVGVDVTVPLGGNGFLKMEGGAGRGKEEVL